MQQVPAGQATNKSATACKDTVHGMQRQTRTRRLVSSTCAANLTRSPESLNTTSQDLTERMCTLKCLSELTGVLPHLPFCCTPVLPCYRQQLLTSGTSEAPLNGADILLLHNDDV